MITPDWKRFIGDLDLAVIVPPDVELSDHDVSQEPRKPKGDPHGGEWTRIDGEPSSKEQLELDHRPESEKRNRLVAEKSGELNIWTMSLHGPDGQVAVLAPMFGDSEAKAIEGARAVYGDRIEEPDGWMWQKGAGDQPPNPDEYEWEFDVSDAGTGTIARIPDSDGTEVRYEGGADALGGGNTSVFAFIGDRLAGHLKWEDDVDGQPVIRAMEVNEAYRGRGIAKEMYRQAAAILAEDGYKYLYSDKSVSAGAEGVYESLKSEFSVKQLREQNGLDSYSPFDTPDHKKAIFRITLKSRRPDVDHGGSRPAVESKEFKKWFAGSKVVDENGKPLVVYHGTTEHFSNFDPSRVGRTGTAYDREGAFFFTDDPKVAAGYAEHSGSNEFKDAQQKLEQITTEEYQLIRAFAVAAKLDELGIHKGTNAYAEASKYWLSRSAEEPLSSMPVGGAASVHGWAKNLLADGVITKEEFDLYKKLDLDRNLHSVVVNELSGSIKDSAEGANIMPVYLNINRPLEVDAKGGHWDVVLPGLVPSAREKHADGLIVKNLIDTATGEEVRSTVFIAFNPNQIKSAIGNRGTFSIGDPDIRMTERHIDSMHPGKGSAHKGAKYIEGMHRLERTPSVHFGFEPDFDSESRAYIRQHGSAQRQPNSFEHKDGTGTIMGKGPMEKRRYFTHDIAAFDENGDIVGTFSILTKSPNKHEIGAFKIAVREDAQGRGWGKKLLDEAERSGIDIAGVIGANRFTSSGRDLLRSWLKNKAAGADVHLAELHFFDPHEKRVGKGNPHGGQWTAGGHETWVDGRLKPKAGDHVYQTVAGFGGMGATIQGEVYRARNGNLRVKVSGSKSLIGSAVKGRTYPADFHWTVVGDPEIVRRRQAADAKELAAKKAREDEQNAFERQWGDRERQAVLRGAERLSMGNARVGAKVEDHKTQRVGIITELHPSYGPLITFEQDTAPETLGRPNDIVEFPGYTIERAQSKSDQSMAYFNGRPFWCGAADVDSGFIDEVHTEAEAFAGDYLPDCFSDATRTRLLDGTSIFFNILNGQIHLDHFWGEKKVEMSDRALAHLHRQISFAPPNAPVGLNAKHIAQTEEFKRWFEGSKIVDAGGNPVVMYHGTRNAFTEFDRSKIGETFPDYSLGGFYFTNEPGRASSYATVGSDEKDIAQRMVEGANVMPVYLAIKNPLRYETPGGSESFLDHNRGMIARELLDAIHAGKPYDGILVTAKSGLNTAVAFNPTQIKSALANSGSYDPNNPDIRMAEHHLDPAHPGIGSAHKGGKYIGGPHWGADRDARIPMSRDIRHLPPSQHDSQESPFDADAAIELMREDAKEIELDDEELNSCRMYKGTAFRAINHYLEGKAVSDDMEFLYDAPMLANQIQAVAVRHRLSQDIVAFRGEFLHRDTFETLKPGCIITDPRLLSSSANPDIARQFVGMSSNYHHGHHIPGVPCFVTIKFPSGSHVIPLSAMLTKGDIHYSEFEWLAAAGTRFKVVSMQAVDNVAQPLHPISGIHLTLEALSNA